MFLLLASAITVLMREILCVGYTPRPNDPRSLQPILDGLLYFETKWLSRSRSAVGSISKIKFIIVGVHYGAGQVLEEYIVYFRVDTPSTE